MNKRRLLKLANLLERDAKNEHGVKFSMGTWGIVTDPRSLVSCGTQACAMGLAGLSKAFEKDGLTAYIKHGQVRFRWKGDAIAGYEAAQRLFGISERIADRLFSPSGKIEKDEGALAELAKAKEIRRYVSRA